MTYLFFGGFVFFGSYEIVKKKLLKNKWIFLNYKNFQSSSCEILSKLKLFYFQNLWDKKLNIKEITLLINLFNL